jgi:hypothetical protein
MCCAVVYGEQITPDSVEVSNVFAGQYGMPVNLINGVGLNNLGGGVWHEVADLANSWATPSAGNQWYYRWCTAPVLTFRFNESHCFDGIKIWNYAPPLDENGAFSPTASNCARRIELDFYDWKDRMVGSYTPPVDLERGCPGRQAQTILFPENFPSNKVVMRILDNWHGSPGVGDRVGLSEVRFLAPEPGTMVTLLSAGVLMGFARRRLRFFSVRRG